MPAAPETAGSTPGPPGAGGRGANACCFCWCCCCSCSCVSVDAFGQEETTCGLRIRGDVVRLSLSAEDERTPGNPQRIVAKPEQTPKNSILLLETKNRDPGGPPMNSDKKTFHPVKKVPSPTLEEVNAWSQSFDKVMLTPAGRNAFREFLRTEFSEENMLFWMACEELKKEANKTIIEEKARTIYEDYISILSPKEVSLDSRVREVINRNMVEPSQHIFDDAQLQIYTLMHRDSYPRFMNSALYKDLLQSLSEKSAEA
ncbi:Regulator of G-protein signaling 20 [Vulpes lagopus]